MSNLDMYGFVDVTMRSELPGGIVLISPAVGDYTGPGGIWEEAGPPTERELYNVNVTQVGAREAQSLSSALGGTRVPTDLRIVHINDGTQLQPDDTGKFSEILMFSDGNEVREWRVIAADNRPWRNFCRAVVERYRGQK